MENDLIKALTSGFQDGGVECSFNYPGFHSHELHKSLGGNMTSVNEYAAYACGWGAAFGGKRTVVSLKNVGLSACADAFLNSMLLGVNSGLVLVVFDDCDIQQSQCRLDSRHYFDFYGGLWFDPHSIQNAYDISRISFKLSEEFECPIVIRVTNILYDLKGCFKESSKIQSNPRPFVRAPEKFVVHPMNALDQEKANHLRQKKIQAYIETLYDENAFSSNNIVYGTPRNINNSEILQLYTLPIPSKLKKLTNRNDVIFNVHEHGNAYIYEKILIGDDRKNMKSVIQNASTDGFEYHNRTDFEDLFSLLRGVKNRVICGDIGGYTMDPPRTIDACLAFGSSVAITMGVSIALPESSVFCVCGDAGFKHSAKLILDEAIQRKLNFSIIILDNNGSGGTGGQQIPGSWSGFPKEIKTKQIDFSEIKKMENELLEIFSPKNEGIKLLIIKLP